MKPNSATEAQTQRACLDLLAALKVPHWRMNAGDRFGSTNGKKWRIRGHEAGTADILAMPSPAYIIVNREGRLALDEVARAWRMRGLWLEIKSPTGKQSAEQKEFEKYVTENGMSYLLVRDVDELATWLRERGVR